VEETSSDRVAGDPSELTRADLADLLYGRDFWPWERWLASLALRWRRPAEAPLDVRGDGSEVIELVRQRSEKVLSDLDDENLVATVIEPRTFAGSHAYSRADLALLTIRVNPTTDDSTELELRLVGAGRAALAGVVRVIEARDRDPAHALPPIRDLNRRPVEPDELRAARSGVLGGPLRFAAYALMVLTPLLVLVAYVIGGTAWWGLAVMVAALALWYSSACWLGVSVRRR
jgi:hypothetical protein